MKASHPLVSSLAASCATKSHARRYHTRDRLFFVGSLSCLRSSRGRRPIRGRVSSRVRTIKTERTIDDDGGFPAAANAWRTPLVRRVRARLLQLSERLGPADARDVVRGQQVHSLHELLSDHAADGDHRDSAVVQLLHLHVVEPLVVLALREAQRVEAIVAGDVVGLEQEQFGCHEGVLPRDLHARRLGDEDGRADEPPCDPGDLLEVVDSGSRDLRVEEEGGSLHLFADEKPERREHRDARRA